MYKKNNKFNQVQWNKIYEECIKRERKTFTPQNSGDLFNNPRTVKVVTSKINQREKYFLDKDSMFIDYMTKKGVLLQNSVINATEEMKEMEKERIESMNKKEEFKKMVKKLHSAPNEKYSKPITASQEIGWFHNQAKNAKKSQFYYPKNACKETKYANLLNKEVHLQKAFGKSKL